MCLSQPELSLRYDVALSVRDSECALVVKVCYCRGMGRGGQSVLSLCFRLYVVFEFLLSPLTYSPIIVCACLCGCGCGSVCVCVHGCVV